MTLTLRAIEGLAPDQASLTAAARLRGPKVWPVRGHDGVGLAWGECQGSGANPYRTAADLGDLGHHCTCPSRKRPCKHVLSLLWQHVDDPPEPTTVPDWVRDWLGRRRPGVTAERRGGASIITAKAGSIEPPTVEADRPPAATRAADRAQASRHAAILGGLDDLDRWLADVLGKGLAAFPTTMHDACRTLARRLVDAKAPGLAGMLDALPARLLSQPAAERATAALEHLGSAYLLGQAYRRLDVLPSPLAADVRRLVGVPTRKEDVLGDPTNPRASGTWACFGARTLLQADDLQRVESWFVRVDVEAGAQEDLRFALLLDYHPARGGRVLSPFQPGDLLDATLVFYPSVRPLRALVEDRRPPPSTAPMWAGPLSTLAGAVERHRAHRVAHPWLGTWPISAGPAAIAMDGTGRAVLTDGQVSLPIARSQQGEAVVLQGIPLQHALGLWDGAVLTLFAAETGLGRWLARETAA